MISQELGQPFINYFSPKDYKSNARNWVITQDNSGIMYFANESGVLEYDGTYWRKIRVPQDKMVRSIDVDKDGKIYVCADTDFGYLEPDSAAELQYVSLLHLLDQKYQNFGEVSDVKTIGNHAYFKTRDKIFWWDGTGITVWDSINTFILHNVKDKIYLQDYQNGLMTLENDELIQISDHEYFDSKSIIDMLPYDIVKDESDSILIVTSEHGLYLYDRKTFYPFRTQVEDYLIENQVNDAAITSDGNYAFATQRGGIIIINKEGELVKIVDEKSGLKTNVCFGVFSDMNGGLWITTEYGIYYIKEPSSLSSFQNSGDLRNISNSVYRFNNQIYAATELGPMQLKRNSEGFRLLEGSTQPSSIFAEFNDQLLVGTSNGTFLIENNSISKIIFDEVTTSILVSKIFPNRLYIGTYDGFSVLEKRGSRLIVVYKKKLPDEVKNIIEDEDGNLWINGFFPGLISVSGSLSELSIGSDQNVNYNFYNKSDNQIGNVHGIAKVQKMCLFLTDKSLYTYNKIKKSFEEYSGLGKVLSDPSADVILVANGVNKSVWVYAYINNKPVIGKVYLKSSGNYEWDNLSEFALIDLSPVISIYPDMDPSKGREKLWLSSEEGLVLYDPTYKTKIFDNYTALIRKVTVNRDSIIYYGANNFENDTSIEIEYSKNDVLFEYSATQFDKPKSTYFKTFLEGNDEEWSNWSLETKKEYTNLSQGDYVFKLIAKNLYGTESNLATYSFTVLSPWYQTWWAYVLYAFFIFGTLFSIRKFELNRREKNSRIKMSELKAESAELQAKAAEAQARVIQAENERKTKELEEARALQLSMLPKVLPKIENIELAVYMKTATEVGGDYYDFSIKDDGSINIALGDATGHGMKAGILVSMIKSLFTANSLTNEIVEFFNVSNNALKNSRLDKMMMAFAMVNIDKQNKIKISNAGIPPIYIYRSDKKKVEEVKLNGLPLGAMKNTNYRMYQSELTKGDSILMLSDGLPELQNEKKEMYGYERVISSFEYIADKMPYEIISCLKEESNKWSSGKNTNDDVTFVVIKVK